MDSQNISVAVRARPLFHQEESSTCPWSITNNSLLLRASNSIYKDNVFRYATVFAPSDDNATVFAQTAAPLVSTVLSGINCTLLAYGQTGSGKTHTILGSPNDPGVVPRAWAELFHEISCNKARVFTVHATFLELYNEELRDLMDPQGDKLQVQQVRDGTCIIPGLRRFEVRSYEQIQDLLQQASNNRVLSATKMNQMSSRSHALFSLIIESQALSQNDPHPHLYSTLVVVDLAGSERTAKSGTETGIRRREREAINLSLLSLGMVINQLTEGGAAVRHVNYRNSLLTRLLQVSLGGNARTSMICTITPSTAQLDESISTLRFASNATKVKNRLRVNVESSDAVKIAHLKQEVEQLKKQGIELQRRLSGTESEWGSRGADPSWEAERSSLVTDLEACRSLVRELQMENVNLQRQIKDKKKMEEDLLATQQMVKELKKQNAVLTANLAFEKEMQQQLQLLLTRSQASLEDPPQYSELMQEISVLTMELQIITAQRDIKEGKCGTLAFKLLALQDKLAASQSKRNQLLEEVAMLKEALENTQSKLQVYIHDAVDRLPDQPITIIPERENTLLTSACLSDKIMSWDADLVADLTQIVYNREIKLKTCGAQTVEAWDEVAKLAHNLAEGIAEVDHEQQPSTSASASAAAHATKVTSATTPTGPSEKTAAYATPADTFNVAKSADTCNVARFPSAAPSSFSLPPANPADTSASPLGSSELREVAMMPSAAACFAPVLANQSTPSPTAAATPTAPTAVSIAPADPAILPAATPSEAQAGATLSSHDPAPAVPAVPAAPVTALQAAHEPAPSATTAPNIAAMDPAATTATALSLVAAPASEAALVPVPTVPEESSPTETAVRTDVPAVPAAFEQTVPAAPDVTQQTVPAVPTVPQQTVPAVPTVPQQTVPAVPAVAEQTVPAVPAESATDALPSESAPFHKVSSPLRRVPSKKARTTKSASGTVDEPAFKKVARPHKPVNATGIDARPAGLPSANAPESVAQAAPSNFADPTPVHPSVLPSELPPVPPHAREEEEAGITATTSGLNSSMQEREAGPPSRSSLKPTSAPVKGKVQAAAVLAVKHIGKAVHGDTDVDSDGGDSDVGDGNRGSESSDIPDTDLEVDAYGRLQAFAGRSGSSEDDEVWVAGRGRQVAGHAPPPPQLGGVQALGPTSNVVLAAEQLQRALDETEAQLRQLARLRGVKTAAKQQSSPASTPTPSSTSPTPPPLNSSSSTESPQSEGPPEGLMPSQPNSTNSPHTPSHPVWVPSAALPPIPSTPRLPVSAPGVEVIKRETMLLPGASGPVSSSLPPRPVPATPRGSYKSGGPAAQMGASSYSDDSMFTQSLLALVQTAAADMAGEESDEFTSTSSSDDDSPLSARFTNQAPLTALVKAALSPAGKPTNSSPAQTLKGDKAPPAQEEIIAFTEPTAQPLSPLPPSPLAPDTPLSEVGDSAGPALGTDADVEDELASPSLARITSSTPGNQPLSPTEALSPSAGASESDFSPSCDHNDSAASSDMYSPGSQADPDLQVIILPEVQSAARAEKSTVSKALSFVDGKTSHPISNTSAVCHQGMGATDSDNVSIAVGMVSVQMSNEVSAAAGDVQVGEKKMLMQSDGWMAEEKEEVSTVGKKTRGPKSPRSPTASLLMDSNFEQLYGAGVNAGDEGESQSEEEVVVPHTGRSEEGEVDYIIKPQTSDEEAALYKDADALEREDIAGGNAEEEQNKKDAKANEQEEKDNDEESIRIAAVRARALFSSTSEEGYPHLSSSPVTKPSTALSFFKSSYMPPAPSLAAPPSTPSAAAHRPAALLPVDTFTALSPTAASLLPDSEIQHQDTQVQARKAGPVSAVLEAGNPEPAASVRRAAASTAGSAHGSTGCEDLITALLASKTLEALRTPSTSSSSVSSLGLSAESTPTHTGSKSIKPDHFISSPHPDAAPFSLLKAWDPLSRQPASDADIAGSPSSIASSVNIPTATNFFRPAATKQPTNPTATTPARSLSPPATPAFGPMIPPVFGPSAIITPATAINPGLCSHTSTPRSAVSALKSATPMHTPRSALHTPTSSPRLSPRPTAFPWTQPDIDSPTNVPSATAFYRPHFAPITPPRVPGQTGGTALQAFSPSRSHQADQPSQPSQPSSSEKAPHSVSTHVRSNSATNFFRTHLSPPVRSNSLDLDSDGHVSGGSSPSSVVIPRATAFYRPNFVPAGPAAPPQISIPSYSPSQALSSTQPASINPTTPIVPSPSPATLKPTSSSFDPLTSALSPTSPIPMHQNPATSAAYGPDSAFGLIPPGPWSFSALPERDPTSTEPALPSTIHQLFQLSPHVVHYPPAPTPSLSSTFPLDNIPGLTQPPAAASPPLSPTSPMDDTAMERVYTPDSETLSGRLLSPPSAITGPISPFHIDLIMDGPGDNPVDNQLAVERSTSSDPVMSLNDIFPKNFVRWSGLRTSSSTCSSLPEDAPLPSSTVWLQPGDTNDLEVETMRQIQELQVWKDTREAELAVEKMQIESFGQGFKDMIEELSKEVLIHSEGVLMQSPLNTAEIEL